MNPILATLREPAIRDQVVWGDHPRAFALPPGALCGQWSIIPHANSSPLDWPMAKGDTEAAAWLAAAERVCA